MFHILRNGNVNQKVIFPVPREIIPINEFAGVSYIFLLRDQIEGTNSKRGIRNRSQ